MAKVTDTVAQLALPYVEAAGCTLWDVEYIKEAGEGYLRVPCPTSWTKPTPSRAAILSRFPPPDATVCCARRNTLPPAWDRRSR